MSNKIEGQVLLRNVRLSFPNLFEPKAVGNDASSKPRYGCSFLIDKKDKANLALINAEIDRLVKDKFGGKLPADKRPLSDGDEKEFDGYAGHFALSANRSLKQKAPTVVDADKTPLTKDSTRPYAGCYVNGIVRFYSIGGKGDKGDSGYGKRICCSLETVQFAKDGDPFGAPRASLDDLPDIDEEEEELEGV